jgi:sugar phosphate permease
MLGCIACQMDLGFAKDTMDVYMTYIVADLGWGRADFQIAGWVLFVAFGITSPVIGYLLDRFGARLVLTTGALALGATFAGYASMTSFAHYLLVTPLLGIGIVAMGDIPASTIVARWFVARRGLVIGVVLIGSNLGAAIVNLLAKGLYRAFDDEWRPAVALLGASMVAIVLPFSLWVIRDPQPGETTTGDPSGSDTAATAGAALSRSPDPGALASAPRQVVAQPAFWLLAFALFAYYFQYLFVNRHIIAFLRDNDSFGYRVPAILVGALGVAAADFPELTKSLFELVGLPAKIAVGWAADRWRTPRALAWNFLLLTIGAALLPAFGHVPGVAWVFIIVHGLGWGAQQVLTPLTIAHCFGVRHMGQIYGMLMLALLPAHVSPWWAGHVFDLTGSYASVFPVVLCLTAIATAGLFLLPRR